MVHLKIETATHGRDIRFTFDGVLDERCELPDVSEFKFTGRVLLNLEKLSMINSLGCRKWVQWLNTIKAPKGIGLEKCSIPVVNQINILDGFLPPHVAVHSIFVPYFCDSCGKESLSLLDTSHSYSATSVETIADEAPCPACPGQMELDVLKKRYFGFLLKKPA